MKIVLAFDSFKGTLSAAEVCEIVSRAFCGVLPGTQLRCLPLADGGEGMAEAWHAACGGAWMHTEVSGPWGNPSRAAWLLLEDGTAVLETAACAGLELARRTRGLDPASTTTRGLGELLLAARDAGARRVLLGLGGSATNDAGAGMAHALGWRFLDGGGEPFCPTGGSLIRVARCIPPAESYPLPVSAACDVTNPLFGNQGAAYVYAPQKGADAAMVRLLDEGLRHFACCADALLPALPQTPGAGAAGGLGWGVLAFLNGMLAPGVDLLLEQVGFEALLEGAALVITGEGRMDAQTLHGKAPMGVMRRARALGVPVVGLCGCLAEGAAEALTQAGFAELFAATKTPQPLEKLRRTCREDLFRAAEKAARWTLAQGVFS